MFGLLNPFLLVLAPLLAGPLVIHFLGRAEPKVRDFPSLMPVRGQLMRAMQRHRLKNWLLLILRTLVLLCLLLAAAGPVWRSPAKWTPPEASAILLHNGAYGAPTWEIQQRLRHDLDSLTPGRNDAEQVIPDAPPGRTVTRFGKFPEAVARLLRQASSAGTGASPHVFIPVFDTRDLNGLPALVRPWLERHPRSRLVWVDHSDALSDNSWTPFAGVSADFPKEGQVRLRVRLKSTSTAPRWVPEHGAARETRVEDKGAEIVLALPEGHLAGSFVLSATSGQGAPLFAESTFAVSYRIPPPAVLCVIAPAGSVARATLGEGGKRLNVVPMWATGDLAANRCDLLYAADPENADAALWSRAAAVLRAGGKVVIGTGRQTDAALLNRNLLVPLGVGHLTALESHPPWAARAHSDGLATLGLRGETWGRPGAVRKHLGFVPGPGTTVLLGARNESAPEKSTKSAGEAPLLVRAQVGTGELLLWTTDIGDPEWSDLGLGPWATLMHQGFIGRTWRAGAEARAAESDSAVFFALPDEAEPRVRDPLGSTFSRWSREPGGVRLGPFDRTGLYHLETETDTIPFAVNLAAVRLEEPTEDAREDAWESLDSALGPVAAAQTARLNATDDWHDLYGGFRLRTSLLVLAALLLLAEGIVSLRLSPFRS